MADDDSCEWMLKKIKAVTMQFDAKHNGYISMLDATAGFLNCRQQQGQTADSYLEALKSHADTIEYHGGTLVLNPSLALATKADGTAYTDKEKKKIGRAKVFAMVSECPAFYYLCRGYSLPAGYSGITQ